MKLENKIMIIENDQQLLSSLAFTLKRREYQVIVASNPKEALNLAVTQGSGCPFDLLIIDVQLPGMTELELIEMVRKKSLAVPILVLTPCCNRDVLEQLKERHIENVLAKPFNSDELVKRVSLMLERQSLIPKKGVA